MNLIIIQLILFKSLKSKVVRIKILQENDMLTRKNLKIWVSPINCLMMYFLNTHI